jgi:hypothetical protein
MSSAPNSAFHAEQPDLDVVGYRPVSKLAVAALLFGLAAASALAHPLLWCVPLLGVVLAIAALVRLKRAEVPMIGRKAAIVGLVLSILFGAIAPVHSATVNYWLLARAQRLADEWFARIQTGRVQEAYDLMLHSTGGKHPPPPGPHGDATNDVHTELETFAERQPEAKLLKMGAAAKPQFLAAEVTPDEGDRSAIGLLYRVPIQGEGAATHLTVQFNVQRRMEPGGERWLISSVTGTR